MQENDSSLVLTVPEAGKLLGLKPRASYLAAERGDIPTVRFGRLIRVPRAALMRMFEAPANTSAA